METTLKRSQGLCVIEQKERFQKVRSESRVTWPTSVSILVFLGLSDLDLGPMYATDRRQTDVRRKHSLMPPRSRGGGIKN